MYFKVRARVFAFVWLTVDCLKFANSAVLDGICCCLLYVFYVCSLKRSIARAFAVLNRNEYVRRQPRSQGLLPCLRAGRRDCYFKIATTRGENLFKPYSENRIFVTHGDSFPNFGQAPLSFFTGVPSPWGLAYVLFRLT